MAKKTEQHMSPSAHELSAKDQQRLERLRRDVERAIHEMVGIVAPALGKDTSKVFEVGFASQVHAWQGTGSQPPSMVTQKGVRLARLASGESVCYDFVERLATPCGEPPPPPPL